MDEIISVILPIYNMENYISQCLESVVSQTYKNIEIICVNDFSMDNSMTIVKNYSKKDSRIKIVNNENNRGLGGARNAGLDVAIGKYIIFCDTDDIMMPNMVERLYSCIVKNDADMAFSDVMLLDAGGEHHPVKPFHEINLSLERIFYPKREFYKFCDIWPSAWNKIYKKSIIKSNEIKYHENILYEDHTFYYEYLLASSKVVYCPECLYVYRCERNDSITHKVSPRIFEIFTIIDYIKQIFESSLDQKVYNVIFPKIATRLIWERTFFNANIDLLRKFNDRAYEYLSQFRQEDVFKYKDSFVDNDSDFLYSPAKRFLRNVFIVWRYYKYKLLKNLVLSRREYYRRKMKEMKLRRRKLGV